MDQADTLRKLMQNRAIQQDAESRSFDDAAESCKQVITISSGKGGVGKSILTANIGAILARSGLRVLLVDGDFGLANLDILLGVHADTSLEQVLQGEASVQDTVIGIEQNLWLLPASSGLSEARNWDPSAKTKLARLFDNFPWEMDVVLVDSGAGIQENVISLHSPSFHSVVVLTPEPTSLTDAYGMIKTLRRKAGVNHVGIIVNQVTDAREGRVTFQKLKDVAARFIDVEFEYLGHCQRDEKITQSVMKRKILLDLDARAPAVPCMELLAKRMKTSWLGWEEALSRGASEGSSDPKLLAQMSAATSPGSPGSQANPRFWRTLLGEVSV